MRLFTLLCFLFGTSYLMAQGYKGDWLFRGDFRANHYDIYQQKSENTIEYDAQVGRFIKNGLCIGAIFQNYYGLNAYTETSYGIFPFVRGSINKGNLRPFLQIEGGRLWHKYEFQSFVPGDKYHETNINLRLGLLAVLTKNTAIEIHLKHNLLNRINYGSYAYNYKQGFSLGLDMNFFLTQTKYHNDNFFLAETVLKKGNKSLTTKTGINLKKEDRLANIDLAWGNMTKDGFRFSLAYKSQHGNDPLGYISYNIISPSIQHYYSLKNKFYFSPSTGASFHLGVRKNSNDIKTAYSIFYRPTITQFFRRASLELGFEGFLRSKLVSSTRFTETQNWGVKSIVSGEYYLSPQLALRGEIWGNLFGSSPAFESLYIFAPEVGNGHLRVGIRYFYQKRPEN